jgi:primosomal protein N'
VELSRLPFAGMEEEAAAERGLPLVRVAVERGIEGDGLTYASPWPDLQVGEQVEVPLARGKSRGVVLAIGGEELLDGLERGRVKRLTSRLGASVPPEVVELGRWIASYYVAPLGMVLASMVPAAVKEGTGSRSVEVLDRVDPETESRIVAAFKATPSVRKAWEGIAAMEPLMWPLEPRTLAAALGTTLAPINKLVAAGLLKRSRREDVRARGYEAPKHADDLVASEREIPVPSHEQAAAIEGDRQRAGSFRRPLALRRHRFGQDGGVPAAH